MQRLCSQSARNNDPRLKVTGRINVYNVTKRVMPFLSVAVEKFSAEKGLIGNKFWLVLDAFVTRTQR